MATWTPIQYRGFWDVPRIFLTRYRGQLLLIDCPFSEELEDFPDVFGVYALPPGGDADLPTDWTTLVDRATAKLGEVPVSAVRFDATRRQCVDASVFDPFLPAGVPIPNGSAYYDPSRQPVG